MRPTIAVIVPTKNSEKVLGLCLESVQAQTVLPDEIIVVDNYSSDRTGEIARSFTNQFFLYGPERSAQRNFGWRNSSSDLLLFVDADNTLEKDVIEKSLKFLSGSEAMAFILSEYGFATGGWGKAKALERQHYNVVDWMLSPRLFRRSVLDQVGGYSEDIYAGEDWELWGRVKNLGLVEKIEAGLMHLDDDISLVGQVKKKYYYGLCAVKFREHMQRQESSAKYLSVKNRLKLLWQASDFLRQPLVSLRMWVLKFAEVLAGLTGATVSYLRTKV